MQCICLVVKLFHAVSWDKDLKSGVASIERLGNFEEPTARILLKLFTK